MSEYDMESAQLSLFPFPPAAAPRQKRLFLEFLERYESFLVSQQTQLQELYRLRQEQLLEPRPDWTPQPLKSLVQLVENRHPDPESRREVAYLPVSAVSKAGRIDSYETRPEAEVQPHWKQVLPGDLLFSRISPSILNGKHAVVPPLPCGMGYASPEFFVLRPTAGLSAHWLHCCLRNPAFLDDAKLHLRGTAQQRIPRDFLENAPIFCPPAAQQETLMGELEALFLLVSTLEEQLLEQRRAAEKQLRTFRMERRIELRQLCQWLEDRLEVHRQIAGSVRPLLGSTPPEPEAPSLEQFQQIASQTDSLLTEFLKAQANECWISSPGCLLRLDISSRENPAAEHTLFQAACLEFVLGGMRPGDTCMIFLNEGVLFRGESKFRELRSRLLQKFHMQAVILLPRDCRCFSPVLHTCCLVFTSESPSDNLWYCDLSDLEGQAAAACLEALPARLSEQSETDRSWLVPLSELEDNLLQRNPHQEASARRNAGKAFQATLSRLKQDMEDTLVSLKDTQAE